MKNRFLVNVILIIFLILLVCNSVNADEGDDIVTDKSDAGTFNKVTDTEGFYFDIESKNLNVENYVGNDVKLSQDELKESEVKTFSAKNIGTVNIEENIESISSISVTDGNARINFMKGKSSATFEINGKGYTFHSDGGYVEWKDGAMFVSQGTEIFSTDKDYNYVFIKPNSDNLKVVVEDNSPVIIADENTDVILSDNAILKTENGDIIKSIQDDTHIKIEEDIPTIVKGKISVDYDTSPFKINLYGTYTHLELNTADDEKFEFINTDSENNLLISIESIDNYMFHDGCKTNCISYRDMGTGHSGELWEKIKIDGNAKILKYKDNEIGYSLTFKEGKTTIGRKFLASMRDIPFNKKTVMNYNNGDIEITSFTSQEGAIKKRSELNKQLEDTIKEIKQASIDLNNKKEEFERLKKEEGYNDELPDELPEDLKQAKKAFEKAQSSLDAIIQKKESLNLQIEDITKTTLWVKGQERKGNVNINTLTVKEAYETSMEKIWLSTSWFREIKKIYDVDIQKTFPNFPYIDEEIIYESKGIRFDLYNKDPGIDEDYSVYELAEKYSLVDEDIPILIALWKKESNFKPDVINDLGYIGLGQIQASSGAFSDVVSQYSSNFPEEYRQYAKPASELTQAEKSYINEELKKREVNVKISAHYFRMMEDKYGFDKLEYQLMGYNAGPTATKEIINEFNRKGGGDWTEFKQFLFGNYARVRIGEAKANEVIGYVEGISNYLGYELT
jgi:hypothetical protein